VQIFLQQLELAAPLFALVLIGFLLARFRWWPRWLSTGLSKFVFVVALPALLFRLMSGLATLPAVDARLLLAFFGGCLAVFAIGRLGGRAAFGLDGGAQSVCALGGIFSNNVLLAFRWRAPRWARPHCRPWRSSSFSTRCCCGRW
jgi:predicted permease